MLKYDHNYFLTAKYENMQLRNNYDRTSTVLYSIFDITSANSLCSPLIYLVSHCNLQ